MTFTVKGYIIALQITVNGKREVIILYYRLRNEIDRRGYTIEKFATLANMSEKSLRNKLNGVTDFSWSEVLLIRDLLDPDLYLEELFKREDKIA